MRSDVDVDVSAPPCAEEAVAFKAVLIYEDLAAGRQARGFFERLTRELDGDMPFHEQMWSFDVLGLRRIRNVAASAAASADMVILALSGEKPLPEDVEEWIEMWLWLIDEGDPALVALFSSTDAGAAASVCAWLGSLTRRKGIAFFPHHSGVPAERRAQTPRRGGFTLSAGKWKEGRKGVRPGVAGDSRFGGGPALDARDIEFLEPPNLV